MRRSRQRPLRLGWLALAAALVSTPTSSQTGLPPGPPLSRELHAGQHYAQGTRYLERAWQFEAKLSEARDDRARHKLSKKIVKSYRMAMGEFEDALRLMPDYYQAAVAVGYALRKTGSYAESLAACKRALAVRPEYAEAIACRAEAYMEMGQLEDAKRVFNELFDVDRERAGDLLSEMRRWLTRQMHGPSEVPPSILEYFAEWLDEQAVAAEP